MRWRCAAAVAAAACVLALLPAAGGGAPDAADEAKERVITVTAVSPDGSEEGGAALAALVRAALRARGVRARVAPPPAACAPPAAAAARCLERTLAELARGRLHAALVPVPAGAAPPAPQLRDAGLEELGDAAPPDRRACFATRPPARSLLDLYDKSVAALYRLSSDEIDSAMLSVSADESCRYYCATSNATSGTLAPARCREGDDIDNFATILTRDEGEAAVLASVVRENGLRARVAVLGPHALAAAGALAARGVVVCGRALDRAALARMRARPLGPPACTASECPFESQRLVKIINARELAHSPSAIRVLGRLSVEATEIRDLIRRARVSGAEAAALEVVDAHPGWAGPAGEVRMAVMIPASTCREAFDAAALRAAAELAEYDLDIESSNGTHRRAVEFKVELLDDGCAATRAFKYLTDALGTEFGALSGVAGPACGGAFADVARQSPGLALPVLAYTPQAPPPGAGGSLALLAAGDARIYSDAWAALLAHMRWHRLAVLSELATRASLDVARFSADVLVHVELPGDGEDLDGELIAQWATRVASANGRVLYVCAEDARVVRAALCAGRGAGLTPAAGAVWLLPAALPPRWLRPAPSDAHNCTVEQLEDAAAGHLSVAPDWLAGWDDSATERRREWSARWRARCGRARGAACGAAPAQAALLYDALRLWAAALERLLAARPAALDDLHREHLIGNLLDDATTAAYGGLTGEFEWSHGESGTRARVCSLALRQWWNGTWRHAGSWRHGALRLRPGALRWLTADGRAPDDGGDRCGLQPLADLLRADCRTAFVALGALVLTAAVAALAGGAWHCKRRAESEYRARLAALGLRSPTAKPGDLDRWEVPRERVVINRKLGTGAFGTVYGGHALLAEDRGWSAVAVKTLKAGATTEEKLDFLSEAEAMKRFDHQNVVRLLGVVTKTEPVCTVMEFMLYGDLKNYLLARRHLAAGAAGAAEEVSASRLTSMALDAARALSYLAQLRYVHRDVAARNCLVSAHRLVKLADFGMTRLVFENDYYRFSRKGMLPVRWMAPESLALGVFSPGSDVWSFGVLLYEIVTFGSLPFQGLSNSEVLASVKAGRTLELPPGLKPQLEGLIKSCWQQDYKRRPGAAEVAAFLADSPRLLTPCLDLPLDALPLDEAPWRRHRDGAEARWVSWAAPASADTDTTYLSDDAPPRESDSFLP